MRGLDLTHPAIARAATPLYPSRHECPASPGSSGRTFASFGGVDDAESRALVMSHDDLDLFHIGQCRGRTTMPQRVVASSVEQGLVALELRACVLESWDEETPMGMSADRGYESALSGRSGTRRSDRG